MKKPLSDAGSVSHQQAIDKAKDEFRKYRLKTLSPVEKPTSQTSKLFRKRWRTEEKKMSKIEQLIQQFPVL